MLKLCLDSYRTQEMLSKAIDAFKFVPDWFVTKKKMIKKLDVAVLANEDIVFFDEDSGNVTFSSYEMVNLM